MQQRGCSEKRRLSMPGATCCKESPGNGLDTIRGIYAVTGRLDYVLAWRSSDGSRQDMDGQGRQPDAAQGPEPVADGGLQL
jgi:hypothetical protein